MFVEILFSKELAEISKLLYLWFILILSMFKYRIRVYLVFVFQKDLMDLNMEIIFFLISLIFFNDLHTHIFFKIFFP